MSSSWDRWVMLSVVCLLGCTGAGATPPSSASPTGGAQTPRSADGPPGTGPATTDSPASDEPEASPRPGSCVEYRMPEPQGFLPAAVDEASGLAVTTTGPVLWLHNDSGDVARLFAVSDTGTLLATMALDGVFALDWEDLALGPCADTVGGRGCLYVGDIGDNYRLRPWVTILRVAVPDVAAGNRRLSEVEEMDLVYPDGARDAEALVVDAGGRVFILTKDRNGTFRVYSAPFVPAPFPAVMSYEGSFDISWLPGGDRAMVTAADYHPELNRLLVRTYRAAVEYRLPPDAGLGDLSRAEPVLVPVVEEAQGEAIAYGSRGYWHVSEGPSPPLYFVGCAD